MTARRPLRLFIALCALWAAASPAGAQITTGTITGNIKDAQSGVIPGATVTLVSATRATTLATVVTNTDGVYVFPNVPPDTYHRCASRWTGSRRVERSGITVSPGDRVALAAARPSRSAASPRPSPSPPRPPLIQSQHRRALLHRRDRLGPEPADQQPQLHEPDLARPWRRHQRQQPGPARRRRLEQHAHGRRLHGRHRQQPAGPLPQPRSDCRGRRC